MRDQRKNEDQWSAEETGRTEFPVSLLTPYWREMELPLELSLEFPSELPLELPLDYPRNEYDRHLVIPCGWEGADEELLSRMHGAEIVRLQDTDSSMEADLRFEHCAAQLHEVVSGLLKKMPKRSVLLQLVLSGEEQQGLLSGLYAFLRTAHAEQPRLIPQLIEVGADARAEELARLLQANSRFAAQGRFRYQDGKRWAAGWKEEEALPVHAPHPWKEQGVYLITGGAGGLGMAVAREIVRQAERPTVILAGRSQLSEERERELELLSGTGAVVEYKRADVSRRTEAEALVQSILADFGGLHGILHSAGTVSDGFILTKKREDLRRVLAPKVSGLVNLDRASRGAQLQFFVLFSSLAGALGNPGQADYAAANAFMDTYAAYRNERVSSGLCQGVTLSINWPLWKEGGMQADEQRMRQHWEMTAMETGHGLQALYQSLALGRDQVLVIPKGADPIREELLSFGGGPQAAGSPAAASTQAASASLKETTGHCLKVLFGEATALEPSKINLREPLESYGIDSLLINQLNQKLEAVFGGLSKTLFYEYQTLGELAEYLSSEHPQNCLRWAGQAGQTETPQDEAAAPADSGGEEDDFPVLVSWRKDRSRTSPVAAEADPQPEEAWEPVAVIGLSGAYPQARNLRQYWENLKEGKDCITEIPAERWSMDGFYHPDPEEAAERGMSCSRWGGFLEGYAEFDPLFFNISPREAMNMDPQERLFLQSCWEALEDAGYTRRLLAEKHNRRVGVFAGITKTGYALYGPGLWGKGDASHPYTSFSSAANRVSYFLNLNGPSMPVDTMCSSSLTAIHEACEHLHRGECEMALAGGVNLYLHPSNYSLLSGQKMLSKDGKCRSFGAGASGFVPGEGVGTAVLKPLSRALADGDPIHAVIRSTSVNHGGKTNGYTVPNPVAQAELIRAALDKAGIDARDVSYMEAHGTGTELGDPIEITGLTRAFAHDTRDTGFCAIGSAKSNIGHLEAAAGMAGLTKIILQMKHQTLVPSLHAEEANPNINFGKTPFVLQRRLEAWQQPEVTLQGKRRVVPRTAGVSSFGAGGSNAHVLLEEYIPQAAARSTWKFAYSPEHPAVIPLSAKNEERLRAKAEELLAWLREEQHPDSSLADVAYTLQVGREAMEARVAVLAGSFEELREKLGQYLNGQEKISGVYRGGRKSSREASVSAEQEPHGMSMMPSSIERDPDAIAEGWARGGDWDWDLLYGEAKPRRIRLPVYPFARERYFIGEKARQGETTQKGAEEGMAAESAEWSPEQPQTAELEAAAAAGVHAAFSGRGWTKELRGLSLKMCLERDLKERIGQLLCIPPEQLDPEENLADFGFDSISLSRLAAVLTKHYGIEISPALFFGHSTIDKIIEYFLREHESALQLFYREPDSALAVVTSPVRKAAGKQTVRTADARADQDHPEPIAIIGMSGRFPGARTVEEMWAFLAQGKSAVEEIPSDRFRWEEYYARDKAPGKTDSKWCGSIPGAGEFDPLFFEISPKEAEEMDPRQRLLLQEAWRALEHAGYVASRLKASTIGMFVGAEQGDYQRLTGGVGSITSNHNAILAARLSYFLNLTGPVLALDTACSSGLAAAHQACLSLRSGECDTALAAGVNLLLTPEPYIGMTQAGMLSKDGQCYAFDKRANGLVPGEAVAVVVLKRLSQAEADGDPILAVIRGSGINYDGRTNGITAPNGSAQAALLKSVYDRSGVDPGEIEYVVTHGTGTKLGDPVEMNALHQAFKEYTPQRGYCAVTSNKTNFGHTFAASGVVSLMNLVQSFRYETIPASLHVEEENDFIPWQDTPFYVNKMSRPWPERAEGPRTGAVSAFGMSGTNVHMVLQSYTAQRTEQPAAVPPFFLLVLSAKTPEALEDKVQDMISVCRSKELSRRELLDIAYTLLEGRQHFGCRTAVVVRDAEDAVSAWSRSGGRDRLANRFDGKVPRDFAGQPLLQQYLGDLLAGAGELEGQASSYREALCALADLYCQGYELDGGKLYGGAEPRIAELPAYPFARDTYWISGESPAAQDRKSARKAVLQMQDRSLLVKKSEGAVRTADAAGAAQEAYELMTFRETWEEQALPAASSLTARTIVCFVSQREQQEAVRESVVRAAGAEAEIICISRDSDDAKLTSREYRLNAANADSYVRTLRSIGADYPSIDAVLYLWPLEEAELATDYHPVVSLLKALSISKIRPARLLLAGSYENSLQRCYLESWIGIARSLGLVLPQMEVTAAAVDGQGRNRREVLAEALPGLCAELGVPHVPGVLYQGGRRQVCRITPTLLELGASVWKPDGTYLLTGGCGGLGLLAAEYIAGKQHVNLILTGRSPLTEERRARLAALERSGSPVHYVQADISDESAMKEGLRAAKERFGPIHGVLHAAGVTSGVTILEKTIEEVEQVLSPKIEGTLVLDALLQGEPLDFVCYFSSSAAVLGDFGSCDYAAANRFQTAYARYRREEGLPGKTVVMNWPLWKDGGMGFADESSTQMYLKSSGQRLLEAAEGMDMLDRALSQADLQHLVLAGQRTRVYRFLGLTEESAAASVPASGPIQAGRGWREEYRGMSLEECLERDLKELVSVQLKIPRDKLDVHENLAEFGYDSILLAAFADKLTQHYGTDITPAVFFGHSTLHSLAGYFASERLETVKAFYREGSDATGGHLEAEEASIKFSKKAMNEVSNEASSEASSEAANEDLKESYPDKERPMFRRVKRRSQEAARPQEEPIAIIGMSGRFPGARDTGEMWKILAEGIHAVQEVPAERFDWQQHARAAGTESEPVHCRWCGTLPGAAEFDPLFFDIPPKEAESMDPRQRLLLQESWKALEDAGYGAEQIKEGRIGMFVGVEDGDYQLLAREQGSITSTHTAVLAARLSYVLNLTGPNMAINTACSSGLVAAHQACMSLRSGECDTALAAGVNLLLTPQAYEGISRAGIVSPDGKCYAFEERANGTVPGEAVAVVVLKRLSQAEADGDPIYAVIRGSGINYDGKTNGITAPSGVAQARLYREVYDRHGIDPEEIEYIVTHGTGTKLGDPVEINALNQAFKTYTAKQGFCALTSAKTNFGHTFAASGLVSLMNLVLSLRSGYIPASLHCEQENPFIDWQGSPFYVNKEGKAWEPGSRKVRTGAVSAFGMSGTNAHMVLGSYEGAAAAGAAQQRPPYYLLALSAKTAEALEEKIRDLTADLQHTQPAAQLLEMSYTLLQGRQHLAHRCAVVIQDRQDALLVYGMALAGERLPNLFRGRVPREFAGQKAIRQYMDELMLRSRTQHTDEAAYRETLLALGDLYCQGYAPDWSLLFGDKKPNKLRLPTYPFARELYWVKPSEGGVKLAVEPQAVRMEENLSVEAMPAPKPWNGAAESLSQPAASMEVAASASAAGVPAASIPAVNEPAASMAASTVPGATASEASVPAVSVPAASIPAVNEPAASMAASTVAEAIAPAASMSAAFIPAAEPLTEASAADLPSSVVSAGPLLTASAAAERLKELLQEVTGIPHDRMENEASFEELGLDSLMITQLNKEIQKWIGKLDSTLFYTYNSIQALGAYIAQTYKAPAVVSTGYTAISTRPASDVQGTVRQPDSSNPPAPGAAAFAPPSPASPQAAITEATHPPAAIQPDASEYTAMASQPPARSQAAVPETVRLSAAVQPRASRPAGTESQPVARLEAALEEMQEALYKTFSVQPPAPSPAASPPQPPALPAGSPADIAIVGVAGRYPKAETLEQFWTNLYEGRDCIEEIPADRWPLEGFFEEDRKKAVERGLSYSKWGGFLERIRQFDPLFFNISPKEAMYMDPQERLFLEVAWSCLENAGYTRDALKRDGYGNGIGVFVGATFNNYQLHMADAAGQSGQEAYLATSQMFSIANRVSYLMNFTGPSLTVDTACSSSLYAIHLACESIRSGHSRMAIAGGVNLTLHPSKYITLCQGQFSASDGRCRAFGEGGTGYVPSEGVGAVFLKPLHEAVSDNDWIYGVIKGTAVSHAGRTNGYTVPSPVSQSQAIEQALAQSGIHPRSISCIEAHGTGTALGDPIEIRGLTDVFGKYTGDTGYCSISSVKSNIGHAEAAAGIAQLTKVLLQMRHETLVKNVMHGHGLNPNIDFASTPFTVQAETAYWQRPVIGGQEVPRRAGISSFGAGGANAHIVIEEYPPAGSRITKQGERQGPALVVLSARSEERLREQAGRLLYAIREQRLSDADLPDIAYTLQVGREAMEERMALLVASIEELEEKLREFADGRPSVKGMFRGQVKRNKETIALFEADEDMQELIGRWILRGNYVKLLELWTKGLHIDWLRLYSGGRPGRIPLPAYPFAGEAYWVPGPEPRPQATADDRTGAAPVTAPASALHPLLQRNTSDLTGLRFSSVFTGREFFLADHVVKGQPVLPGVAYLEMARAAAEHGAGLRLEDRTRLRLRNVVWARPIVVGAKPVEVHVELFSGDGSELDYEVCSGQAAAGEAAVLHSQGSALQESYEVRPSWDLSALLAEFGEDLVTPARIYDTYDSMGISYGPAHQGIQRVYTQGGRVLAKLSLPEAAAAAGKEFILHPSLMDSALQATIALMMRPGGGESAPMKPGLPFALQEMEIYGGSPDELWALIRYSEGSRPGDRVQKLDIDLFDDAGQVYVRMKSFSTRTLESPAQPSPDAGAIGTLMLEPVWNEHSGVEGAAQEFEKHLVVLCETGADAVSLLHSRISGVHCLVLRSGPESTGERFAAHCTRVFEEVKALLAEKPKGKVLVQIVVPLQDGEPFAGLSGLLMAAQSENGKLVGQVIETEESGAVLADRLIESSQSPRDKRIRYQQGKRWSGGWAELKEDTAQARIPWKDGGVYLLTGGAGGLGLLLAQEITDRVQAPILILTGRSPLGEERRGDLEELQSRGARAEYRQVDVTDAEQVTGLLGSIVAAYGKLDGIVHGAGVIRDNLLQKKTAAELREVLAPKVQGLALLDEASRDIPLDFMIAFSSVAGATGNPGQTDYSAANAFLDAYAAYRNRLTSAKRRHGRMLSVNWPLWKDGGMQVDGEVEKIMLQSLGTVPMPAATGMEALYRSWASGRDQVMVQVGQLSRIRSRLLPGSSTAPVRSKAAPEAKQDMAGRLENVQAVLMAAVSKLLMVKPEDIDVHSDLNEYGFDSISLTQFANRLNDELGLELTPTVFFEYTTLHEVAEYLIAEYPDQLGDVKQDAAVPIEVKVAAVPPLQFMDEPVQVPATGTRKPRLRPGMMGTLPAVPTLEVREDQPETNASPGSSSSSSLGLSPGSLSEPIAIVGMSGRFPKAKDLNEFWLNMMQDQNCIVEIPEERWDWREELGDSAHPEKSGLRWGGFIDGVETFDPLFFGISPREAEAMDPQQRLLLMQVWKAVEDAGMAPRTLSQRPTGVFVAAGPGDYMSLVSISKDNPQAMTGVVPSLIPNRISYALDLKGPSEYCETACSSTLVALHRAVRSIHQGECEQAIVGAVNLLISPVGFTGFDAMGYLSPDGQAKSFQPEANGFVRSEGVGALLIKPLSQAQKDGNPIYALIRGTGVAHGGAGMSLTSPHAAGMKAAMAQAFNGSGIHPRTVSYIEAHGIASPMADGIEVQSLRSGYLELAAASSIPDPQEAHACYIGSVKPVMGHAEVASGLASLIKAVQAIRHQVIPGVRGFTAPNPHISLEGSLLRMTDKHQPWEPLRDEDGRALPLRAAINSYGIGGVNAHVLIEEYAAPEQAAIHPSGSPEGQIVVLSAKNAQRLEESARQLLAYVQQTEDVRLPDLAYTLQVGREAMEARLALVVRSREELVHGLTVYLQNPGRNTADETTTGLFTGAVRVTGPAARQPLSGTAHETGLQALFDEAKLDVLARKWTEGAVIPWELLHQGRQPRRLSLPTYPFEQRRCWPLPDTIGRGRAKKDAVSARGNDRSESDADLAQRVTGIIARLLGMHPSELHPGTPLDEYGLDSILLMQLLRELQREVHPSFDLMKLQECRTLEEVQAAVQPYAEELQPSSKECNRAAHQPVDAAAFPELILLNKGVEGSPVFWFHGGLGGVEMYQALAQTSRRPFYGIQARGWMTGRSPLQGIGAMAAYYVHILLQVQPEGPYDLGGYSLGGVIAYEVVRQLQELGKTVNTVVMLDSPYGPAFQQGAVSRTSAVLQAVNLALASKHFQEPDQFAQTLIHRDEVSFGTDEEDLLQQLIRLGSGRGLTKTEAQLKSMIEANVKIQHAYQFDRYTAMPLPDPGSVTCYYFRNKGGRIFGELEPFFSTTEDSSVLDRAAYWEEWERQFPRLHIIDVDASNHMVLLSEAKSYERIFEFSERLYSGRGITGDFLQDFKDKMKQVHGTR
ncbi:SDR family NAD(P)-dependent oxidoreductase [Paenibacillus caseinilyticus]|uniref:SDR family NAD(P)-dependent oxidoreductase n=1 Tax=Paenibacillus caseinilyticus TaxID=3098138 RepID=UPI0022B87802|nr:SDR family NAD(P)-dependent oxidoreductase [Paenibacillus caseinilyticus]MCZ8519621.1 SDR family NAD(P)-dependent oxidoreductase [Paenibacillus caseinilyticus]